MTRVQLVMSDEDRDRYFHQARREGMTLSAWLMAAARERLEKRQWAAPFKSPAELEEFFRACDVLAGPEMELDWSEHLALINESQRCHSGSATP